MKKGLILFFVFCGVLFAQNPPQNLSVDQFGFATWNEPESIAITEAVFPQSADYWTGSTDGTNFTSNSEVIAHDSEDGWMNFDISLIPDGATILEIEFNGYVNDTYYPYWQINGVAIDPLTASPADLMAEIQTNLYNNFAESSTFAPGWKVAIMEGSANSDLQAALINDWFCLGINSTDNSVTYYLNFDGWNETNPPFLNVTYEDLQETVYTKKVSLNKKNNESSRILLGYNVYLDGVEVAHEIPDTTYQYEDLNFNQTYTAGVSAVHTNGESSIVEYPFTNLYIEYDVSGYVYENTIGGNPLENVEVKVDGITTTTTIASGYYSFSLPVGTYDLAFSLEDHAPVLFEDFSLTQNETLDVALGVINATVSSYFVEMTVDQDSIATATLNLTNTGVGPINWNSTLNLYDNPVSWVGNDNRAFGDEIMSGTLTGASWGLEVTQEGVFGFGHNNWYAPPLTITHYDFELNEIDAIVFPDTNLIFLFDPAYDPITNRIIAIESSGDIYAFPPVGFNSSNIEIIGNIGMTVGTYLSSCAYDYNNNDLYLCDSGSNGIIAKYDLDTEELIPIPDPTGGDLSVYGMTYMPNQPDGYTILANMYDPYPTINMNGYNPITNQWSIDPVIANVNNVGGLSVSNAFNPGYDDVALGGTVMGDPVFTLYEGLLREPIWLTIDPNNGQLENNGDIQSITINADITAASLGGAVNVDLGAVGGAEITFSADYWSQTEVVDVVVYFDFTGIENGQIQPVENFLSNNYPNPFNPTTTISFSLKSGITEETELVIYNLKGQKVKVCTIPSGSIGTNELRVVWNGTDDNEKQVSSGIYFYKLKSGDFQKTKKMILMK